MPVHDRREYRIINMADIETREADDQMIVVGYAATFGQEYELYRYGNYRVIEVVDRDALTDADMRDVIMQYNHEGRVFARRSNGTLLLDVDDHGLHIEGHLEGTELGRQVYAEIKGGYTTQMSFGFTVREDKEETIRDADTGLTTYKRTILRFRKIYDVSAVAIPANPTTEISARSASDGVIARALEEFERRRKAQILKIRLMTEV